MPNLKYVNKYLANALQMNFKRIPKLILNTLTS